MEHQKKVNLFGRTVSDYYVNMISKFYVYICDINLIDQCSICIKKFQTVANQLYVSHTYRLTYLLSQAAA